MENNLESYLAAIEAQLSDLPAARRAEFVDEARAHLHAMVEAKRADGWDEARAVEAALSEFGEASAVGRALREQWANSAQLESEGAPLSWRDVARKFGWRLIAVGALGAAMFFLSESVWEQLLKPPVYALLMLCVFGYWIFRFQREGRPWTIYNVLSYAALFALMMHPAAQMQWPGIGLGNFGPPVLLGVCLLMLWALKRERANRPWQWSARFKTSPVAAEQEYRLTPLIGLAMGTAMGCVGLITMGLQFFGLPLALLSCAGLIAGAIGYGWWLIK